MFNNAIVLALADFEMASFLGRAYFMGVSFSGTPSFAGAEFFKTADFSTVNFPGFGNFSNCHYRDEANLGGAKFADKTLFDQTKFDGPVTFNHAFFEGHVRFNSTRFSKGGFFRATKFKDGASFENIQAWGNGSNAWSGAFFGASASGVLSFENSVLPPFAAFNGLHLERDALLSFDDAGEKSLETAFDHQISLLTKPPRKDSDADKDAAVAGYPSFLDGLAGGCRVFKNYFDSKGDRERAQRFFRLELQARMKSGEVGRLERSVFWGYRIFSNYGASVGRPFAWLASSVPSFAMLYWIIAAACLNPISSQTKPIGELYPIQTISEVSDRFVKGDFSEIDTRPMLGALSFSAHRTFPFGAWDVRADEKNNNMRKLLLGDGEEGANFTVRVLATVQSIFSLAMIFLSGLAIRRRFKMD